VLILTPVKDAELTLPVYWQLLRALTYPRGRISLGFLESDSSDRSFQLLRQALPGLQRDFRRALLWKRDFGFRVPSHLERYAESIQVERRTALARSRNHLLFHALDDEDWVLWLDADLLYYPPDIIETLLATGREIVHPHCVLQPGGPTFDRNAWSDQGRRLMDSMRDQEFVRLDAVGGTMLWIKADLHRDGLIFPPFPYGRANERTRPGRGEIETEGLGMLAHDMGLECWGMPNLEILHHPF
jgi:peptide chain release factor subunit 1